MAFLKLLASIVVFVTVLLLDRAAKADDTCTCHNLSVCEAFEIEDVVLRGTARLRSKPAAVYGGITYTMDITAIYKGKPGYDYGEEIRFTTAGSNAACGVYLELDEEYLIGFLQRDDKFRASLCGLVEVWNSVTDDDKASVAAACEDDPCDGSCGEFQECRFHSGHLGSEYLCADACEPTPCGDGEVCTFEQLAICSLPPCPPAAVCN